MEVLTGGIYGFDIAFPVSKNRYWINAFFGTTFLVMYKNIFRKILEAPFDDHVKVDGIISELTSYKATFFPFISGHKEFGADKEIKWSNKMWPLRQFFTTTADRLELTQRMYDHFHPQQSVGKVAWSRSINELLKDISKGPPPI
jgi:hypothetical protein